MVEPDNALMMSILRELRGDQRKQLTLLLQLADAAQRHDRRFADLERRISESRDEIELMVKSELMGRLTHFEVQMDERIAQLDDRIAAMESGRG